MAKNKKARIPHKFLPWIAIRKQYSLTHAEVQMARELGLEPRRFPSYANIKDQPWKKPLKEFIAELYLKQTGKEQPETVYSMEDLAAQHVARRLAKKQAKLERLASEGPVDEADETVWPNAESTETAAETAESEAIPTAEAVTQPVAQPIAEATPPVAEPEQPAHVPEPIEVETSTTETELETPVPKLEAQPQAPAADVVVANLEPEADPEPVAAKPDPEPTPEPVPKEAPPAKPASPWEAARARLNAKSEANPDDPDLTSGPAAT
ncbi:hypothetical protein [Rhodopirellula baltica]|uniref:Uncharacterized protein n=1 Tax=Rhodopirellula baltica SWK14 TaxID=993516 RepID=L7C5T9_RHOBT|nr:hypothetical protein [Rhodopirellula baltica]ELP29539.1 hypothetical protein RBSWK_06616 [Rhodopirellula baltica SWK14]